MGPKSPRSTVLTAEEEAAVVAFRRHTLLPLDDCLYALQATIRISLGHPCIGASNATASVACRRSPGTSRPNSRSNDIPIGYFHIDIAEVMTEEGKLHLFVAVDRTSKFAFAQLHEAANVRTAVTSWRLWSKPSLTGSTPY